MAPSGGLRYFAGRLVTGAVTLWVVSVLVFSAVHLVPGGYPDIVLGPASSPQVREALRAEFGLDRPLVLQYLEWVRHVLTGDLGTSLGTGEPVSAQLMRRLPVTAELAGLSLALTVLAGVPLALLAGLSRGRFGRGLSRLVGSSAMSVPDFVLGSLLVFLFSRFSLGLPVGGYVPLAEDPVANLRSMALPALTLSVFGLALVVRTGRDAVAATFSSPHIAAALARGERIGQVTRHHVLRNAAIPVLTVLATYAGYLMGGAVIVENLFSLPGVAQAVLNAINGRDYATVQGLVLVAAAVFIAINLLADFAYGVVDPRIRAGHRG
ncbi:ABC transporter permease [Acrocarpospora macrocephala]|uniref:Peptide ABC transporter permease n=1 Tax=Acrocarpospora macrocephala TaxID=150177 RepID=A0A5M3WQS2_9ACTN|nr:ABC transporter permease [Acrocarpospora macrocephala]GES10502.1 peptide ABC transporter permease [Acrocarpospora macrocephala]